jgi:hypothetical protein
VATRPGAPNTPPSGPPPSQIQTAANLVQFDPKNAVPQQPIYLQRNDQLLFLFFTTLAAPILRLDYRWLTPEGEIKEGQFNFPTAVGVSSFQFELYEGWLLSFTARITNGFVAGQWSFLQALISRTATGGIGAAQQALIWQGFINTSSSNGWPGTPSKEITDGPGVLRAITGTLPAAGAEINEVVPANRRWTLLSLRTALSTSAVAGNRFPGFRLNTGAGSAFTIHSSTAIIASQNAGVSLAPGGQFFNDTNLNLVIPWPANIVMKNPFAIASETLGIQAADQYNAPVYTVLEWGLWDA